jgi:hypothetical protein
LVVTYGVQIDHEAYSVTGRIIVVFLTGRRKGVRVEWHCGVVSGVRYSVYVIRDEVGFERMRKGVRNEWHCRVILRGISSCGVDEF